MKVPPEKRTDRSKATILHEREEDTAYTVTESPQRTTVLPHHGKKLRFPWRYVYGPQLPFPIPKRMRKEEVGSVFFPVR